MRESKLFHFREKPFMNPIRPHSPPSIIRIWMVFGVIIIALLGGSIWLRRSMQRFYQPQEPALPVLATTRSDFTATERDGMQVRWKDLRGKVVICAYLYTVCPHGCAAVVGQMPHGGFSRETGSSFGIS